METDNIKSINPGRGQIIIFEDVFVPGAAKEKVRRIQALVGTPYDMGFLCQYALQNDLTDKKKYDHMSDLFFKTKYALDDLPNYLGHADETELRSIAASVSGAKNRSTSHEKRYLDGWKEHVSADLRSGIIYELEAQLGNVRHICDKLESSQVWCKLDRYGLTSDLSESEKEKILSTLKETEAIGKIAKENRRIEKTYGEYRRAIISASNTLEGISSEKKRSLVDRLLQYASALETIDYSLAFCDALEKSDMSLYLAASGRIKRSADNLGAKDRLVIASLENMGISLKDIPKDPLIVSYIGDGSCIDDMLYVPSMDIYSWFLEGLEDIDAITTVDEKSHRVRLSPRDRDTWADNYSRMHVYADVINELKESGVWVGGTKEAPVLLSDPAKFPEISLDSASGHVMKRDVIDSIIRALPEEKRTKAREMIASPMKDIAQIYGELKAIEKNILGDISSKNADMRPVYYSPIEPLNEPGYW